MNSCCPDDEDSCYCTQTWRSLPSFPAISLFSVFVQRKKAGIIHACMHACMHKKLENTDMYTQLINFETDEWHVAHARNLEEENKLIEAGF